MFVDPVPDRVQLEQTYDWDQYHERMYADVDEARYVSTARRLAALWTPAATSVLDFGCGAGGFLRVAHELGFETRGVEFTPHIAAAAASATGRPVTTLEQVEGAGLRFDVVVLRDVLPHLPEPVAVLRRLEALLLAGGRLVFDGPLEEGPSLVRAVAGSVKRVRRAARLDRYASFAPTMLVRVDARAQRRFFVERMGYVEELFERYETGWPYHVPGRRLTSIGVAVKEGVALAARAAATVAPLGNRFFGAYRPSS